MDKTTIEEKLDQLKSQAKESKEITFVMQSFETLQKSLGKKLKADEMVWEILTALKKTHLMGFWPEFRLFKKLSYLPHRLQRKFLSHFYLI